MTTMKNEITLTVTTNFSGVKAVAELDGYLKLLKSESGSDLHLSAGLPAKMRVNGIITNMQEETLPASETEKLLFEIMPSSNRKEFERKGDTDFAYDLPEAARFRVNIFRDMHGVNGVFRLIPNVIQTVAELGIPERALDFCRHRNGLVLVTGPTGSGKSTTLAALIDVINRTRQEHIITIEDPIEFVHKSRKCLVNQREVGSHTSAFAEALRAAFREDPDVVLLGEMRDLETARTAIETAETGHLVFATLHTRTASSTVDRLISQFPVNEQEQIRVMVASSLRGVISQTLLQKRSGGRIAAFELLIATQAVRNNIREHKLYQITSTMQIGAKHGMICLNDSLLRLALRKEIDPEEALSKAEDRDDLLKKLRVAGLISGTGEGQSGYQQSGSEHQSRRGMMR